jgi:hypothetical protein
MMSAKMNLWWLLLIMIVSGIITIAVLLSPLLWFIDKKDEYILIHKRQEAIIIPKLSLGFKKVELLS